MIGKMSKRQFILLFMTVIASPLIRGFPFVLTETAKQAGWLVPLASSVILFGLMVLMNEIFKKNQGKNLIQLCCDILTRPVGIAVAIIYLGWIVILLGFYIRYFGEHIVANIMSESALEFIMLSMLILVGVMQSKSIIYYARLNELIFSCFVLVLVATGVILLFTRVEIDNLLPVSQRDIKPILKGGLQGIAILGHYMFIFFMFDDVKSTKKSLRLEMQSVSAVWILSTLVMVGAIGSIGYNAVLSFNDSYFTIAKNIDILGFLERLDAILLAMWVLADFTTITIFGHIATSIVRTALAGLYEGKGFARQAYTSYIILIAAYLTAVFGFKSKFELEMFARNAFVVCNIVMSLALPVILFTVGKLRKLV